ncbi:hypothetical protein yaldo0001_29950 [Yersinia aldovae ATCC 35236]|uniref:Uncharacterized protein n=1 Tax=Yersinia aldovae TaxID=29483 RepID=A0A0T9UKK7_YERAL|nr:hypothetical protein AT01_2893 [Yersinia aldovae 670-83]EEP96795.1 hypothetical protein yaldo0001_29950 [Yersinia aldovae ATCC 35236]CNK01675.1 Uncharacterised protein [Yersinia aldovae]CNL48345.1 Uncharacterised protein [Yersinia aldovae]CNL75218.1 Uncharacterised protein [Yersinia aldovae]
MFKAPVAQLNVALNKSLFVLLSAALPPDLFAVNHDIAAYYLA